MAEIRDIDEDAQALIEQLCTHAGILMEDTSVVVLMRPSSPAGLRLKIELSRRAVHRLDQLLGAASALLTHEATPSRAVEG